MDINDLARHSAIVGPSGAGKTYSLIAPWICSSASLGLSAVAVDAKGDLLLEMAGAKKRMGVNATFPLIRWDVLDPRESASWNPLAEVDSPAAAAQLANAFLGESSDSDHAGKYFSERDNRWLRGAILLAVRAFRHPPHPAVLYRMMIDQAFLRDCLSRSPADGMDVIDLAQFTPGEYSRATSGISNRVSWLADPTLRDMLAGSGPRAFRAADALAPGTTVVVGARLSGGERSMASASMLLNFLRLRCLERFGGNSSHVIWFLDEVPRYAAKIDVGQMLAVLRGANSPVCIALQKNEDFGDATMASRLLENCDVLITLNGVSSISADYFSRRLGTVQAATVHTSMTQEGLWAPTLAHQQQPRLGVTEIMYPPVGERGAVIQIRSLSPQPFLVSFDPPKRP